MNRKRIFLLHPSHHHSLSTAALPTLTAYSTPLSSSPLPLDTETISELSSMVTTYNMSSGQNRAFKFTTMSASVDEAEHSAEMQLPYIHRLLQLLYPNQPVSAYPLLIPIMIGSTNPPTEATLGKILAPYIADDSNAFIISSDFCHWGSRFGYTYYIPDAPSPAVSPSKLPSGAKIAEHPIPSKISQGIDLRTSTKLDNAGPKIYESIAHADRACMCAIAAGRHSEFLRVLRDTGNTVCGRHPIGTFMAGVEEIERVRASAQPAPGSAAEMVSDKSSLGTQYEEGRGKFNFVRYERSSDVESVTDSSVSYVAGYAVLEAPPESK